MEIERGIFDDQNYLRSSTRTYRSQSLGLSVRYPASWEIELDPLEANTFTLLNPSDFGENISFSKTEAKYEAIIRETLNVASQEPIKIDDTVGVWVKSSSAGDPALGNVIFISRGEFVPGHGAPLYYIAGQAKQFERIIKSIKFLVRE